MIWNAMTTLWLLPLAALPIIIYYWMRRHPLTRQWGAHYVLERAMEKLKRKLINEHMILLAIRTLLALVVILAFARPALENRQQDRIEHTGIHRVVVLDASYSMLAGDTGDTRWDRALEAMDTFLAALGRGETWSLYVMDDEPGWKVEHAVVGQDDQARASMDRIRISEKPAALGQALQEVAARFDLPETDLLLLCDDQALTWRDLSESLARLPVPRRVFWLHTPLASYENAAVAGIMLSTQRPLAGHPIRAYAQIQHHGEEAQEVRVQFLLNEQVVGEQRVTLLPGLSERVHQDLVYEQPGAQTLAVRLDPDVLSYDDLLYGGLEVVSNIAVLVLSDSDVAAPPSTVPIFTEFDNTQRDLGLPGRLAFTFHYGPLSAATLEGQDVVFIDASRRITPELIPPLTEFIAAGGGLVLAPGWGTQRHAWNRYFGQAPWYPGQLGENPDWAFDPDTLEYRRLGQSEFGDDAFRAFRTRESGVPTEARFFHWFDLLYDPAQVSAQDILMRFDDHRPYLIRRHHGAGRCLLLASGFNGLDNTLPVREIFPALLYRLFMEAAAGRSEPYAVRPQTPIRIRLPQGTRVSGATIASDTQAPRAMTVREDHGQILLLDLDGMDRSGLATLRAVGEAEVLEYYVGVQGYRTESDLRPLSPSLGRAVQERWPLLQVATGHELVEALLAGGQGVELYSWLMALVVLLLLLELAYQRRFTKVIL